MDLRQLGLQSNDQSNLINGNASGNNMSSNSLEDDNGLVIHKILSKLKSIPGKVSEKGIKQLAINNKFEIFEEEIPNGRRISLGGSIIVIDVDFVQGKVSKVSLSLASSLKPSCEEHSFTSIKVSPSVETILLESLQMPRLDTFSTMFSFLSSADKLSSSSADCFRSLDEISHALFAVYDARLKELQEQDDSVDTSLFPYGIPVLNPIGKIGLGIWYWTRQDPTHQSNYYYAMWNVRPLQTGTMTGPSKYAIRYSDKWLKSSSPTLQWSEPGLLDDAKSEFVLVLDPPVLTTHNLAERLHATTQSADELDRRGIGKTKRTIHFSDDKYEHFHFSYMNLIPSNIVKTTEIPIAHPKDLSETLIIMRKLILLQTLWQSVTVQKTKCEARDDRDQDVSFADAINECENMDANAEVKMNVGSTAISVVLFEHHGENCLQVGLLSEGISLIIIPREKSENGTTIGANVGIEVQLQPTHENKSTIRPSTIKTVTEILEVTQDVGIACAAMIQIFKNA